MVSCKSGTVKSTYMRHRMTLREQLYTEYPVYIYYHTRKGLSIYSPSHWEISRYLQKTFVIYRTVPEFLNPLNQPTR